MRSLAAALLIACALPAAPAAASASACPVISARLGLHYPYSLQPENSLAAIIAAKAAGAGKAEVDAQFSRYGVPVAIHDATVNRTTAATGLVSSYSARALEAMPLKIGNGHMSGQHVPSLLQALQAAAAAGLAVSVEIKPAALTPAQASAVASVIARAGILPGSDIRSYIPAVLAAMRGAGYQGHLTLTVAAYQMLPAGSPWWQESIEYDAAGQVVTAAQVAALHAAGVTADVYTPDTAAALALVPAGAGQVTTDNVTGAAAAC